MGKKRSRSLIDYIAVDERLRKDVLDAKVVRGALKGSDQYAVVKTNWSFVGRMEKRGEVK